MNGSTIGIPVTSEPPGVSVMFRGRSHMTPAEIQMPRGEGDAVLRFTKDGYEEKEITLRQVMSGWVWGNVLLGGLIGLGIDMISRKGYSLEPNEVLACLQRPGETQPSQLACTTTKPTALGESTAAQAHWEQKKAEQEAHQKPADDK